MLIMPPSQLLPKRVLMTGDSIGGVWTYALELARGLMKYEIEVALATMGAALTKAQQIEAAAIPNLEVHESTFKLEWMDDPWDDLRRAGDWLLELEQVISPNLVHLNTYVHGALPWSAPMLMVGHSCVLSWWEAVKGETAPENWEAYRRAVRRGLRSVSLVIAPSRDMLFRLHWHYGLIADGQIIANGLNPAAFKAFAEKKPYVFAAGRLWDEAKNIQALEIVAPRLDWPIYIAGDDRYPGGGAIEPDHLHLLGRLSAGEMNQWLSRAAIYALPARYEPFGLSVLEAALSGCALVLGDIDSLREIWQDAALFVKPDDAEELFSALSRLIKFENLRLDLADRARRRGLKLNSWSMAAAYVEAYKELLQKHMLAAPPQDGPSYLYN